MPSIESVELSATGRRRRAVLTVTGAVVFDRRTDEGLNGAYLRVRLHAVDGRIRDLDDLGQVVGVCDTWFDRGSRAHYEPVLRWSGRHNGSPNWLGGGVDARRGDVARFRFRWDNRREKDDRLLDRSFNEDRPGRDEVVAVALCLPSLADGTPEPRGGSTPALSSVVSGRF
jgi:hypothetical protein